MQSSRQIEGTTVDQTLADHRYQTAFMGEAGGIVTYDVTSHLSLRATCQAVWIEGVAWRQSRSARPTSLRLLRESTPTAASSTTAAGSAPN